MVLQPTSLYACFSPRMTREISSMKIHRNFRKQSAIVISLLAAAATLTSTAHAQMTCAISLEITKGGFVVGASGGRGVLNCAGKRYELEVSGLNAGLVIGMSRVSLRGTARNLQRVSDIEGTYSGVGASAAAGGGASNIVARNANGVQLTMRGTQAGLEASLNLGGTRIRLKR